MSTVKEIEAAIPKLSTPEIVELRTWLDGYFRAQGKIGGSQNQKARSVLRLPTIPGRWMGETVLKSGDFAEEMFAAQ